MLLASVLLSTAGSPTTVAQEGPDVSTVASVIRNEALRPNNDPLGRPLPLAAHWNTGHCPRAQGMHPDFEISLVEKGEYVLPSFHHQPYWHEGWAHVDEKHYETAIRRAAGLRLPLTFVGTQWEAALTLQEDYLRLPPDRNPNAISPDGKVLKKVSPFGPVEHWKEVGGKWTATPLMKKFQEWYPELPLVVFLSNNEHSRLCWHEARQSERFLAKHGKIADDDRIRQVFAEGWIERYRALQQGMRDGLIAEAWKRNAIFVGYEAFGPAHFGRWGGWTEYSLTTRGRADPWPLAWDGGTPPYYVHNWNPSTDYVVWSPHVEANNWLFMLKEAWKLNPEFWWEISVWDGYEPKKANCMRKTYAKRGQTYGPVRYRGFVQFGMWLLRPRVVREFRGWTDDVKTMMPYYSELLASVKRVHENGTLSEFWRKGKLVPNRAAKHPYQHEIPQEYRDTDRWFLLDTNLTPGRPWKLDAEIHVWAIALVLNDGPRRRWLIYVQSPLKDRKGVVVSVPGYGEVTTDVSVGGSFYVVEEEDKSVRPLGG